MDELRGGELALVGSGEYLTHMSGIEGALLEGRPPRYVQLATAAVLDGPSVVEKWHRLGREQAARLGVEAICVPVATRDDANSPELAEMIRGAGLIYMSGGHPGYLAETLRDTLVWQTIVEVWRSGASLAGCSAGAMAMATWVPSIRHPREGGTPGLNLLAHLRVIPHFDAFAARLPDLATRFMIPKDDAIAIIGVDEDTAIVGGPYEWRVEGKSSAWRLTRDGREEFPSGSVLVTPAQ